MGESIMFYGIIAISIVLIGLFLFFLMKKLPLPYNPNPYEHKGLKNVGISVQAEIIQISYDEYNDIDGGTIKYRYYVLEFIDKKREKHLYKIYQESFEENLNISDFFSKMILKKFKVGDRIKLYVNPKNHKEYYIDPKDIFVDWEK